MRELKFRAWDLKDEKWWDNYATSNMLDMTTATGVVFQQYTGLKDKNGVEIYEGDIVKLIKGENLKVIVWDESDACFDWKDANNNSWPDNFTGFIDEYEVIGNIYENPDLLGNK